jgi:hypothetical protein
LIDLSGSGQLDRLFADEWSEFFPTGGVISGESYSVETPLTLKNNDFSKLARSLH